MLNTFDNDNAMLLASVQELTAELATAQSKIAELEKGGGGGGDTPQVIKITISPEYSAPPNTALEQASVLPDITKYILAYMTVEGYDAVTYIPIANAEIVTEEFTTDDGFFEIIGGEKVILNGTYTYINLNSSSSQIHQISIDTSNKHCINMF